MVDYNAEKSADIISRVRADDAQWPAGAMLFGPFGGKEIVIYREFEDDVFVARCNDAADAARLCRARDAARDLADQLEAAGAELRISRTAHAASSVLREQVTAERDTARSAHSQMSEAYDRVVAARHEMEEERDALRRQVADLRVNLQENLAVDSGWVEPADPLEAAKAEIRRLRQQLDNERRGFGDALKLERESADHRAAGLRQQLETEQKDNAELRACVAKQDTAAPTRDEVDRVARLLIAEWERVEHKPVNVSYVSTFADMARVVIADAATLRQQLEAAQREVAAAQQQLTAIRAALQSPDGETLVNAALRVRALAEQRLEDLAAEHRNRVTSEMEAAETLAMAQRRIADLETRVATGEEDIAHLTKVRRETHMILTENKVDGLEVRATARARMAEFAAALQKLATSEHVVMRLRQHDERQAARITSLDGELEAKTSELAGLRQQLEAAQRECDVKQHIIDGIAQTSTGRAALLEKYESDLAAAQQRIAALEADAKAQDERWAGTLDATFAVGDGTAQAEIERCRARVIELEAGLANSLKHEDKLEKRIHELETTTVAALTNYAASLEATLRAIAPVFQAAGSALGNLRHGPGGRGGPGECDAGCVKCSVSTARAALTPELLGVLGRVTAPVLSALSEDEAYTLSALVNDDRRDWSTAGSPIIIKLLRFHGFTGGK
jgi:hypothetical protein